MDREIVLECRRISHWFGANRVLFDINLKIIRGEIVSLVGPSGCGKSTLLRAIVGTHPPCEGDVIMTSSTTGEGMIVKSPSRDCGIVYQHYSLFPFLTARENVAIGPMLDRTTLSFRMFNFFKMRTLRNELLAEADALLETLKLGKALNLYPHEMSGGMRQRVAIAQALIMKPEILLLDEPFGALDEATREELQKMMLTLYSENCAAKDSGKQPLYTIIIVTHELNEAIYVGDRVVALSQYWNWKEAGLDRSPGATIVYDQMAPVYFSKQVRDFEIFLSQRQMIRKTAFEPDQPVNRNENVRFWDEINAGKGHGVLK
ncbi:MAG: ATP-binding cassette domain-containing protein [Desulfosalsimonadaceae bacterium]|nr:ATP-binding cassette domain-containing protein [Desulfosalsimonadaceae bacterium]